MAILHFLGTASALPTADRTNTLLAITGKRPGSGVLIDCGGAVYSALCRAHIAPNDFADLFITHSHIDHIGSLPSLIESLRLGGRSAPLRIWGIPEVLAVAQKLIALFDFELTLNQWSFDISFHPVEAGARIRLGAYDAVVRRMDHAVPSAGLRIDLPRGTLAYTSDTQPSPSVRELGRGARVLITECTFLSDQESFAQTTKHMTAYKAGELARECGVDVLALVHLGEGEGWPVERARDEASKVFSGTIVLPRDLDTLEV